MSEESRVNMLLKVSFLLLVVGLFMLLYVLSGCTLSMTNTSSNGKGSTKVEESQQPNDSLDLKAGYKPT